MFLAVFLDIRGAYDTISRASTLGALMDSGVEFNDCLSHSSIYVGTADDVSNHDALIPKVAQ